MRIAFGLKAHTGWAALIALGGDVRAPHFIQRARLQLLPDGDFAPYHAAEGLESKAASKSVERSIAAAHRLAESGLREAVGQCENAGHDVCGCGVLIGPGMPDWSTDEILAVHFRMHKAEGELFRNVLVAGAQACGLALSTLPDKTALDAAAKMLGVSGVDLDGRLAALRRVAGPPWGKDQKEAAAAALVAIRNADRQEH